MNYSLITDAFFLNSNTKTKEDFINLFESGLFSDESKWADYILSDNILGIENIINSGLKKRMSLMSIGVFYALENGAGTNILPEDEIYLFSGFAEIDTTDKIIKSIIIEKDELVSPTLFHNSVHNTALGYYTIIKKMHNYCTTISDGLLTNLSFIHFIKHKCKLESSFVVVTGEEYSEFYKYDKTVNIEIKPAFASFRITPNSKLGFKYIGEFETLEKIKSLDIYKDSKSVFCGRETFISLKKSEKKNIFTEYPITKDDPCSFIFRLAMPFIFNVTGSSIVIDKTSANYSLFEVKL